MKKSYIYLLPLICAAVLSSCGGKDDPLVPMPTPPSGGGDNGEKVEVTISTAAIQTKAAVLEFTPNYQMNVYAKVYDGVDATDIVKDIKATYDGNKWTMSPQVYVSEAQKNAFFYAVAPYDASYTTPGKIPVDLDKQVDLMYSGAAVPASMKSNSVKLNMNHALSLMTFNITPVNYSGAGKLTKLAINGDIIYCTGTMNVSNGKITRIDKGEVKKDFSQLVTSKELPGLWMLPFNTKTGEVTLTAVIDGKEHSLVVPEVEVAQGWQYIFRLVLTDSGLEFDPSKTETISLNVVQDEDQKFDGYGKIVLVASGSALNSPTINGNAVFGTLSTPAGNSSYKVSQKVEGLNAGDKVVVESWNSDGFVIESLDGIQTIDISEYE